MAVIIRGGGCAHCGGNTMGSYRLDTEPLCCYCMPVAKRTLESPMEPFPFSEHRGDRQLAAQLLYEHGLDSSMADMINPQIIECLAGAGRLCGADLYEEEKKWRNDVIDRMSDRPPTNHPFNVLPHS